jgi:hypothetical protein
MRERILVAAVAIPVIALLTAVGTMARLGWIHTHRRAGEVGCPRCGFSNIRRSMTRGLLDRIFARFLCMPFRCRVCRKRFYLYVEQKVV